LFRGAVKGKFADGIEMPGLFGYRSTVFSLRSSLSPLIHDEIFKDAPELQFAHHDV
jgi:hypothetical protein